MLYERFTERARKVMQLANNEAQRFNHEYIGTEHILLGLIKEARGVAGSILAIMAVDLHKVRTEVEKLVQSGPDMVTMGKLPQTPRARKVIEYSMEEAQGIGDNHVGTEHILLGLLREGGGVASQVLMNLGLKLEDVRKEVLRLRGKVARPPMQFLLREIIRSDTFVLSNLDVVGHTSPCGNLLLTVDEFARFAELLTAGMSRSSNTQFAVIPANVDW